MKKLRLSTKMAIVFVIVVLGSYFGYQFYSDWRISQMHFLPVEPGRVNLVGVDLGQGFRIVVANEVAQLRELSVNSMTSKGADEFSANADPGDDSNDSSSKRNRIPLRDMLEAMQGNEQALSNFVMTLNDIRDDDLPPVRVYWTQSDIEKALQGDPKMVAKLERDLNVKMDGTPLPEMRQTSVENGIVILLQVPVKVSIRGVQKTLIATVKHAYKPQLIRTVEKKYEDERIADANVELGYYIEEAKKVLADPSLKKSVTDDLKGLASSSDLAQLAVRPEHVLQSAQVVVNENFLRDASYRSYDTNSGKIYTISFRLTSEGSDRLWAYSKGKVGTQLLLVVDGVAVAAPRIAHELSESNFEITQMPDLRLVRQTVDAINSHGSK